MIEIARPALLGAGALAALLPLALHLLRPQERDRRLLPTARFLSRETRTRIRTHRLPDHIPLLILRMAFCLILGAALSGMRWVGPAEGVGEILIVDRGPGMAGVWSEVEAALSEMVGDHTLAIVLVGRDPDGSVTSESIAPARLPEGEAWTALSPIELGPGEDIRLVDLLGQLRLVGGGLVGVELIQARILTRARWSSWHPGTALLREEIWPAGIGAELINGGELLGQDPADATGKAIRLVAPEHLESTFWEALELWGYEPTRDEGPEVELIVGASEELGALWLGAEEGTGANEDGKYLLLDGRTIPGAGRPFGGSPPVNARIPLLRSGGRPAAAATGPGLDEPCRITLPVNGEVPILGDLLILMDALLWEGCGVRRVSNDQEEGAPDLWHSILETAQGLGPVPAELIRDEQAGLPLARLLLAVAFILALVEFLRVRRIP